MATVKVLITLKPGVLDAPGQAIRQGLRALGYEVEEVRVGKYLEIVVPERAAGEAVANAASAEADEMCARFLANPLIETWQIAALPGGVGSEPPL